MLCKALCCFKALAALGVMDNHHGFEYALPDQPTARKGPGINRENDDDGSALAPAPHLDVQVRAKAVLDCDDVQWYELSYTRSGIAVRLNKRYRHFHALHQHVHKRTQPWAAA